MTEPDDRFVKLPDTADEAAAMVRVGVLWLHEKAPEMLRAVMRGTEYAKDAERYRWLRAQHWNESPLCVVADPKDAVKLGRTCPSGDYLDMAVDDAISREALDKLAEIDRGLGLDY